MASTIAPVLASIGAAADAAINGVEAQVQPLTDEGVQILESVVAPKLDIPSFLLPLVKGEVTKIAEPLDAFATAELELLKARIGSLL